MNIYSQRALWVAFALFCMSAPWAPARAQGDEAARKQLERAEWLMSRGEHREAVRVLKKAERLAEGPSARVQLALAICFNRLGEFGRSERHARAALAVAVEPDARASAYYMLGLSLAGTRPKEAEAAFSKVLDLTDDAANIARLRLGEVLIGLGRQEEGCATLAGFLEVQPTGQEAAWARSAMYSGGCGVAATAAPGTGAWTEVRTDHFRVVANDATDRVIEIATGAERLLATLEMLAPGPDLFGGESISLFGFADADGFASYRLAEGDAGFLVVHPHGVYAAFETREDAIRLFYRQIVLHFLDTGFPGLPAWFRQGVAEVYSYLRTGEGTVRLGLPIEDHMWVLGARGVEPPIARVVEASARQADEMEEFAPWSWAMVHYLSFGDSDLRGRIEDYLRRIAELERPRRAFEQAFGVEPADLGELVLAHVRAQPMPYARFDSARLTAEVTGVRQLSDSEAELALAELALHTRPGEVGSVVAKMRRLSEARPESAPVWTTLGEAEASGGNLEEAIAALGRAVELDGESFKPHLLLGGVLLQQAQASSGEAAAAGYAEAITALDLAVALRPDSFPAWERLSYAHASGSQPSERAVEAASRALALRPGRTDLVFNLLLVRAKRREVEEVRALLRRLEALGADSSRVTGAREMLHQLTMHQARELMAADRLDDAVALLAEVDARTTDEALRAAAREWMRRIAGVQQHNLFVERYNRAVVAYDADDWDAALEILRELVSLARPGMQIRLVESLRAEVEYWRD